MDKRSIKSLDRKDVIAKLSRMGYKQSQIAQHLGISQPAVSQHLKQIKEEYSKDIERDNKALINEKIELIKDVRCKAEELLEKSLRPSKKIVIETMQGGKHGGHTKEIITKEIRPNTSLLSTILETVKQERELLGLDPAKDVNVNLTMDWDTIYKQPVDITPEEQIEDVETRLAIEESEVIEQAIKEVEEVDNPESTSTNGNGHTNGKPKKRKKR